MNTSALLGTPDVGTIGGMIGAGLAGPRRIRAGGARDHLLGAHAVSGFGDSFKAGGKVVKNVTGYDLCKLLAGSWGTLAVMTEVTLKVMPRPESERTLVLRGLDDVDREPGDDGGAGLAVRRVRCGASAGVRRFARATAGWPISARRQAATLLRLEGITASAAHRAAALAALLAPFGAAEILRGCRLGGDLELGSRLSNRSRPTARWARGRCGGSSVRRRRAARSARRWRATPAAT